MSLLGPSHLGGFARARSRRAHQTGLLAIPATRLDLALAPVATAGPGVDDRRPL